MSIELFERNKGAYRSAVQMLTERGRAAVIHPTGTGKSFIAFRLCADNPDKRIVWLSPSEYIYKTRLENIRKVSPGFDGGNISFFTYAKLMLMTDEEIAELAPAYIILDEFHRAGAESWGAACSGCSPALRKSRFSAYPRRAYATSITAAIWRTSFSTAVLRRK